MTLVAAAFLLWVLGWWLNARLASGADFPGRAVLIPALFGVTLLAMWELVVRGLDVPLVILPAPSEIADRVVASLPTLAADAMQTVVKGALSGYAIGCGAGILVALLADRYDALRRGLLPVGNFMAALPIVGTAPIFVMWWGFGWESKAAVVAVMTFFPMLVNTVAGLRATDRMQRDLMHTYGVTWTQSLTKLRIPAAMPFVFNGLKICTTLALIGAIVAEFFGSPVVGMGFRISTSVGQLALDMVWAEIVVAALAGSLLYGAVAWAEARVTFWHPSRRT